MSQFEDTQRYVERACRLLDLGERIRTLLVTPFREIRVEVPIELDSGEVGNFIGYRVQHNRMRGPMKGGLRFHPSVDIDDVRSLASLMTWKTALAGLPYGGAKGGIAVDPGKLSERELERLSRKFVDQVHEVIGPRVDIPAPDVNTNAQVMAWIMDEYSRKHGHEPAVVTGKPLDLHGCAGREEATGLGCTLVLEELLRRREQGLEGKRIAVQGFGNVGSWFCRFAHEREALVTAVSDVGGAVESPEGLDIPALVEHARATGSVAGFSGGDAFPAEELLTRACDVLVPAALGGVLHEGNASEVRARIVLEAANGPTTPEADEILEKAGVTVVPDILANAGGVTVSYFEWAQNIQQFSWSRERVVEELTRTMHRALDAVERAAEREKISLRTAAFAVAVGRVARATTLRGL